MHYPTDSTYHSLCYTSCGALAGTKNTSMALVSGHRARIELMFLSFPPQDGIAPNQVIARSEFEVHRQIYTVKFIQSECNEGCDLGVGGGTSIIPTLNLKFPYLPTRCSI